MGFIYQLTTEGGPMYPSNPSVQNEPYPQRVASTTVMTLARHVRSAAGS